MSITPLINHLSKYVILNQKEIELLSLMTRVHELKKNDFIVREGEICMYDSFVVKGCLKIFQTDENGKEHIISFAVENWWALDMYSFIGKLPAIYSIQAMENTQLIQFTREQYDLRYEVIPKLNQFTRKMLENSYVAQQTRILENISLNVEDKYKIFVSKYPNLETRISQKYIASYLGVTPEFLSRMKNRLIQLKK